MNRKSHLLIVVLLAAVTIAVFADNPNSKSASDQTVTIALVESGEVPRAQSAYAGAKLAMDQFNALNGSGGFTVQLEHYKADQEIRQDVNQATAVMAGPAIAVLEQISLEASEAAAVIYDGAGIPVIAVGQMSDALMVAHPAMFNVTYTLESEAAYLANYLRKINGVGTAAVIYSEDLYGQTLANQFANSFRGLGGLISLKEGINPVSPEDADLERIISKILSNDSERNPLGTIYIATDAQTAAKLVILLKRAGITSPIMGPRNMSNPAFLEMIKSQSEEISLPGYFTDGILTTRSIIFDSANRFASQFLRDYQAEYAEDAPGDLVVNGYEATLALLAALRNSDPGGTDIAVDRRRVSEALQEMDLEHPGPQGIIDTIYFTPSRNVGRAARFGIYQSGGIASANTQFLPINKIEDAADLSVQIDKGRVITVNGDYVHVSNVVYSGIDIVRIDEIDLKNSTYKIEFYLWFRYRPNEQDKEFTPDNFVFTNVKDSLETVLVREEPAPGGTPNPDGAVLRTYRVSGVFRGQFSFHDYPFDQQKLVIEFRNQTATTSFIQYVVDRAGMRYSSDQALLDNYSNNGAFDSLVGWRADNVHVDQDIFPSFSTFGSPENFDRRVSTNFSLINLELSIKRDSLQYVVKSLLPLLITLILAYITFFLPLGHSERLAVGSTALLTTAFFHLSLADALPEIGYTVAMEYLFYAAYTMSALIVLLETVSIRMEKSGAEAKRKVEKIRIEQYRHNLDMVGRIVYPSILGFILVAGSFIYRGTIHLGPKAEAGTLDLASLAANSAQSPSAQSQDEIDEGESAGEVTLTLSNWRPEDMQPMQAVLAEFESYALKEYGRQISIEYKPVVSRNYASILDVQFSRNQGPDLLYVYPFSVDGDISKYLQPLNDLEIEQHYDATKIIPWENKTGTIFAIPFYGVVQGVYYNMDLFTRFGISEPKTWEELQLLLLAIKEQDPSIVPIANSLNPYEDSEMFMSIAANFLGGPAGRELLMKTDGTSLCYNSRPVVNTFDAIAGLEAYLPHDAATLNSQGSKELFFNQKAAMLFGGSWDLLTVEAKARFDWGVFAAPAPRLRQTYIIFQPDAAVGMSLHTTHPLEARLFLEWLMSKQAVDLIARNLPGFYPLNRVEASGGSDPSDMKFLNLVNKYPADIRWMYTEISTKKPSALDSVRESLNAMVVADLSAQAAADKLQNDLAEWYLPAQTCRKGN